MYTCITLHKRTSVLCCCHESTDFCCSNTAVGKNSIMRLWFTHVLIKQKIVLDSGMAWIQKIESIETSIVRIQIWLNITMTADISQTHFCKQDGNDTTNARKLCLHMFYTYFTKMGPDNPTTTNEQTARSDFFVLFCAPYKYSYLLTQS